MNYYLIVNKEELFKNADDTINQKLNELSGYNLNNDVVLFRNKWFHLKTIMILNDLNFLHNFDLYKNLLNEIETVITNEYEKKKLENKKKKQNLYHNSRNSDNSYNSYYNNSSDDSYSSSSSSSSDSFGGGDSGGGGSSD